MLGRKFAHVRMGEGVISDFVTGIGNCLHLVGVVVHPEAAKEKSCLDVVFLQGIKNKVRFVILPCSVDCKRDALVASRNAVNGQLLHQPRKHFKFILFNTAARCRTRQIKARLRFASGRTVGFGAAVPAGKDRKCNCGNNDKQHRRRPDEGFFGYYHYFHCRSSV